MKPKAKAPKAPSFFNRFNFERKMIADIVKLGQNTPHLWMSFQLDITPLVNNLQNKTEKNLTNLDFPTYFIGATSQVLNQHRGFLGHVNGRRIEVPEQIRLRISSKNVLGRTVSTILTNPHEMEAKAISSILRQLLRSDTAQLLTSQRLFFDLPWWIRSLFYHYWLSSSERKGLVLGNCYLVCNGNTTLDGPITTHTTTPWTLAIYFSDVYSRENRHNVTVSLSADHRILDAYHLKFFAESLEMALKVTAH